MGVKMWLSSFHKPAPGRVFCFLPPILRRSRFAAETMPDTIGEFAPVNVRGAGGKLPSNNPNDPLNEPGSSNPNASLTFDLRLSTFFVLNVF
jgi:hypothetical protein